MSRIIATIAAGADALASPGGLFAFAFLGFILWQVGAF